jgi:DNA-binding GntR family transcriptional regulator
MVAKSGVLLSQQIFERLEAMIGDRLFPPGSKLVEDEISRELGVSRTPVREAFKMLERAGWIEIHPHAGAYVRNPSIDEVREVFEVRQWLEERAAQLAARHAIDGDKRRLRKIIEKGNREVERRNAKQIIQLNAEFHRVIAESGRNKILAQLVADISRQVRWHFSALATIRGTDSWKEHEGILDAIEAGEVEEAGRLALEHCRHTQEAFFVHLVRGAEGASSVAT